MGGRGRLIAVEGVDGCGKSTQARLLAEHLGAVLTHEPGAGSLGAVLREALLGHEGPALSPRAEALLMAADRAQHVAEVLEPALSAGRWVVTDRFSASTLAYQGYGRGLDVDELRRLVGFATGGLEPDLNLLIDVSLEVASSRRSAVPDRLEQLPGDFHQRVHRGYRALVRGAPARWAVVDGSGEVVDVAARVRQVVAERLGEPRGAGR